MKQYKPPVKKLESLNSFLQTIKECPKNVPSPSHDWMKNEVCSLKTLSILRSIYLFK
jgi:hypothetical protein